MKRKDFIARSWMITLAAGGFSCPAKGAGRRQTQTAMEREAEMKKFREQWVATLMANLESQLDAKTRTALMESWGRGGGVVRPGLRPPQLGLQRRGFRQRGRGQAHPGACEDFG
jgi:hypothetical protein